MSEKGEKRAKRSTETQRIIRKYYLDQHIIWEPGGTEKPESWHLFMYSMRISCSRQSLINALLGKLCRQLGASLSPDNRLIAMLWKKRVKRLRTPRVREKAQRELLRERWNKKETWIKNGGIMENIDRNHWKMVRENENYNEKI